MMPVLRKWLGTRAVRAIAGCGLAGVAWGAMSAAPAGLVAQEAKPAEGPKVTYDEHVRPILREHCFTCHNQNG